jgi:hypothetical protein
MRELERPARFCNRYVSSQPADADFVGTANTVAARASSDLFDALNAVDGYQGRPPHLTEVAVRFSLRRGERRAFLLSVRVPHRVRPGQRVRVGATLRRVRGGRLVRHYRVRIPSDLRPGRRELRFVGLDADQADEGLLSSIIFSGEQDDGAGDPGPGSVAELADVIRSLHRYDGVMLHAGREMTPGFRDPRLRISGRAFADVRVVRR